MIHLQSLPTELLDRIFYFIAEHDDLEREDDDPTPQELYNLCLVSQEFRDLAQPLLFRNFTFDDDVVDNPVEPLVQFTKAVVVRPELGQYVRTASIDLLDDVLPPPDELQIFIGAVNDLPISNKTKKAWIKALEQFDPSALIPLLVQKTPNLRALRIPHLARLQGFLSETRAQDPSFLSSLDQLWITCEDDANAGYNIALYDSFISSPKMLSPTFECGDLVENTFPDSWGPSSLAAQELAFNNCHIDAPSLQKFLTACKRVKSFTYQNFEVDPMDLRLDALPNSPEFTAEDLHAALLPHRDTLEHVHLEYARDPDAVSHPAAYADYCNSRAKIPSFEGFPNLETIFLQHAILPPHPRFSPAVQRLDITDCNSSIREMITHIANDVKANLYPKLTEIKVLAFDITKPIKLPGQIVPRGQTPEQCFLSLQNVFKGTKVDFQIYPYEMPDLEGGPFYGDDNDNPEDADPRQGPFHPPVTREQLLGQLMRMAAQDPELAALVRQDDSDESWDMDEE